MFKHTPFLAYSVLFAGSVMGQSSMRPLRGEAVGLILPVECSVIANGGYTDSLMFTLYRENERMADITPARHKNGFILELDVNSYYTVFVEKNGYRSKSMTFDTHLPEGRMKYKAYKCTINLEAMEKFEHSDPWYLDFPSALVRWDEQKKAFTHSTDYLADIQTKMALLGAQIDPK
ncbi:MAG TPA: hypothetical protein PL010_06125 [Flavobacteriales bacterium]|nr:hypothetical protein [Flavobacteriales bacterium]HMW95829.1 hypothetical protein [Flavobacteriales bacterium]HNE79803.1 hypothetical protein [Flavobacteriales bacterium]HNI04192.1 hypothetical protein [Flavobacteriales bacterium]HNK40170.1 hypothetical protein [Flavobacteriales bacterium]